MGAPPIALAPAHLTHRAEIVSRAIDTHHTAKYVPPRYIADHPRRSSTPPRGDDRHE